MKVFIVLAIFAATASASLIASPALVGLGYNPYAYAASAPLLSSSVSTSYVSSPVTTRIVSPVVRTVHPISTSIVAPITTTRLVSSPVVTRVKTITPVTTSVHVSPVAHKIVAPISTIGIHSAPVVSSIVAPSLHSSYGSGLYASAFLAKKV